MDATRTRRTRDNVRQVWYATSRSRRFARHMGFSNPGCTPEKRFQAAASSARGPR